AHFRGRERAAKARVDDRAREEHGRPLTRELVRVSGRRARLETGGNRPRVLRSRVDPHARHDGVRSPKAKIADGGILKARAGSNRLDATTALTERDGQDEVELQTIGHSVRPEK